MIEKAIELGNLGVCSIRSRPEYIEIAHSSRRVLDSTFPVDQHLADNPLRDRI